MKARKAASSLPDNKQKQHDNKRVNNQPATGVSINVQECF